jgi:hypothetical protein
MQSSDKASGFSNRNLVLKFEKIVLQKLFQINHVVLTNQGVSVLFFHLILFLSFLQILFNIFYKVEIENEFGTTQYYDPVTNTTIAPTTFRVDQFFVFVNFHFYVMQGSTDASFVMLYSVLSGILVLFIFALYLTSGKVFEDSKNEDNKEGTRVLIMALSVLMCLFLFIL